MHAEPHGDPDVAARGHDDGLGRASCCLPRSALRFAAQAADRGLPVAPPQISAKQNFRQCGGNACAANQCGPTCGIRDLVTLPGHFLRQGYDTIGMGKIFHEGTPSAHQDTANEFNPGANHSWSPEFFVPAPLADGPGPGVFDAESEASVPPAAETWPSAIPVPPAGYPIVHKFDLEDHELMDGRIAARAVETLANLSRADTARPFFLAVGLHRPHCPWCECHCFAMTSSPSDPGAAAGRRAGQVLGPLPERVYHAAAAPLRTH